MRNLLSKKNALILGAVGIAAMFSSFYLTGFDLISIDIAPGFIIFLPFTLLAVICCFLKREVFRAWFKFSLICIPLYFVLFVFLARDSSGGWSSIGAGYAAMFFLGIVGIYVFISVGIIAVKSFFAYRKK